MCLILGFILTLRTPFTLLFPHTFLLGTYMQIELLWSLFIFALVLTSENRK